MLPGGTAFFGVSAVDAVTLFASELSRRGEICGSRRNRPAHYRVKSFGERLAIRLKCAYDNRRTTGGRGGIGRHARLRIWCRKVWRFESSRPHLPLNFRKSIWGDRTVSVCYHLWPANGSSDSTSASGWKSRALFRGRRSHGSDSARSGNRSGRTTCLGRGRVGASGEGERVIFSSSNGVFFFCVHWIWPIETAVGVVRSCILFRWLRSARERHRNCSMPGFRPMSFRRIIPPKGCWKPWPTRHVAVSDSFRYGAIVAGRSWKRDSPNSEERFVGSRSTMPDIKPGRRNRPADECGEIDFTFITSPPPGRELFGFRQVFARCVWFRSAR